MFPLPNRFAAAAACLVLALGASAHAQAPVPAPAPPGAADPDRVVARVDGDPIATSRWRARIRR